MRPLAGSDRIAALDALVADFDAVVRGEGPRVVSLESSLGLGKTRLIQELFARLAAERQPGGPYWRVDPGRRGEPDSRVLRLASQPEVVLRTPGERDIASIPRSELAALAGAVSTAELDDDRGTRKRHLLGALGLSRLTAAVDRLLDDAMDRSGTATRRGAVRRRDPVRCGAAPRPGAVRCGAATRRGAVRRRDP